VRAIERADNRWLILCSVLVGTAFLTKMLQAFTVVPVFALVYMLAAPTRLRRRLLQLSSAALALVVSSGWWVAIVELTPASNRPYIGGSQDNSLLSLIFGYNGFGRLTGNESGSVGGGGGAGRWGATGWDRLFSNQMGTQVSWLIPAALMLSFYLIWQRRRRPRTDLTRAATLIFVGWLVVTGLVISYAQGIIHPYYTVVLAPAIGALVGLGAVSIWQSRDRLEARVVAAAVTAATAIWAYVLLNRTPDFYPQLRLAVMAVGILAAVGLLGLDRLRGRLAASVAVAALAAALASPAAYALSTASTPHEGAIPSAGPSGASFAGPGGLPQAFGQGQAPPQGFGAQGGQFQPPGQGGVGGQGRPAGGGLLGASTPSKALTQLLQKDSARYRWVAAVAGANSAAGYQLATGQPVMAIGGFNGTDPTPTRAQFKAYVRQGKIHYFISSGGGPGLAAGSSAASRISTWVSANYQAKTVGNVTVYNLG
jgi:4-amino-4-deoxy-L-arabinose transferase-like glycosyltransferase